MPGIGEWSVIESTDPMTDEIKKRAAIASDDGHTLSISRVEPGGAVWAIFMLSKHCPHTLSTDTLPMLRTDQHPHHDLGELIDQEASWAVLDLPQKLFLCDPTQFSFLLWHGANNEGITKQLAEMLAGDTLLFRYCLEDGTTRDTTFKIANGKDAILSAIDARETHICELEA